MCVCVCMSVCVCVYILTLTPSTRASPFGTSDPLLTASPADPLPQNETRVEVTTQGICHAHCVV